MMRRPDPVSFRDDPPAGASSLALPDDCIEADGPGVETSRADGLAPWMLALYGALGAGLGLVFTQAQVISWFRIYEMFRFESFHMYGIIGSAVVTAALGLWVVRQLGLATLHGEPIVVSPKAWGDSRVPGARYWLGGTTFGLGWALLGACPGPLVALLGGGVTVMIAALLAAMVGTWTYAALRDRLPH